MATVKNKSKQALPGAKRMNAFAMEPEALTIIGLDTKDGPEHPLYDERVFLPVEESLVRNIRAYGVLEAVSVRKNGGLVEVIVGRQRVRAAREANRRNEEEGLMPIKVPCFVKRAKDKRVIGVMVSENEHRRDDDAITRANKAQRMLDFGNTEEEVAIAFGITKASLKNLLSILDLSDKVQKMIADGKVPYSAAITLRDLPRKEQETKAVEMAEKGVTVTEAKRQRRARKSGTTNGDESTRGRAIGVKILRKVADDADFMEALEPQARDMLRWILGDENAAKRIKGLTALLRD